ncbi:hypothetical protein CLV80_11615 [Yoonia maritima]|uniref:DUF6603 domain-containing protein n=1 Tax=Yoonia maritima TaxID=1435347 RepID=A0A2T0VTP7_9RHOB|nr:DUF6603 domain-containing protein [Yoonia maritima]PRY74633.1 hypothetical protein CLV80_11615 [Yoonia maritima]
MSTFQTIINAFKKFPTSGSDITLTPQTFNLAFVDNVFNFLLQSTSVKFTSTTVIIGQDSATLKGTADVFDYTGIVVTLTFNLDGASVTATISCDLGAGAAVHLPLLTWITLEDVAFWGTITETRAVAKFHFGASLKLDTSTAVPVTLDYQGGGVWSMTVASGTSETLTSAQVVTLLGGSALNELLPAKLETALTSFAMTGLEATFNAKTDDLSYFNTGFSVSDAWPIAPGVTLEPGLGLSFTMTEKQQAAKGVKAAAAASEKHTEAQIKGTLKLGGTELPLRLDATIDDSAVWQFGLQPGQTATVNTFADLLSLAGDTSFASSLPAAISTLPSIDIDRLNVVFDSTADVIKEVSFKVQTAHAWTVLPNYFVVEQVKLDFDITDANVPADRKVIGEVYGAFNIATAPLFCRIKNTATDQDWVIEAGLLPDQKLNLTSVASQLFDGVIEVPDTAPQIVFSKANLTVKPKDMTFELSAASTDEWVLIDNHLSIKSLSFDLSRTPKTSTALAQSSEFDYKGNFEGKLEIGGVTVTLSAALNAKADSGVDFKGTTDTHPIPFGTWISDFANLFGQVDLPDWLTGITLSNLAVTYNTKSKNYTFTVTLKDTAEPGLAVVLTIGLTHEAANTWTQVISAVLTYSEDGVDLKFSLTFTNSTVKGVSTKTTRAVWSGKNPPGLSDFLVLLGKKLDVASQFPQALNWDATLSKMIVDATEATGKPTKVHAAGQFDLDVGGNTDWSLYFAYTNDTTFDAEKKDKTAVTLSVCEDEAGAAAPKTPLPYVFGVALGGPMDVSNLPLVGSIPGIEQYNIDKLGFYYTNATFPTKSSKLTFSLPDLAKIEEKKSNFTKAKLNGPKFNLLALFAKDEDKSSTDSAVIEATALSGESFGSDDSDGSMSLGAPTAAPAQGTQSFAADQTTTSAPIAWLDLNKTIGPVSLEKVGLSYSTPPKGEGGELGVFGVYFNGGFALAGLDLYLDGLGITFPLPKPGGTVKDPISQIHFHLNGLFMSLEKPNLTIAGGFLNLPGDSLDMLGQLSITAGPYGLDAYGAFSGDLSDPSLFLFVHLMAPIGGPPSFFIDGVSGGFGVNRDFVLPTIDQLADYPLLPSGNSIPSMTELSGISAAQKLEKMQTALQNLATFFPQRKGQYWFAAGLDVTTYEMIKTTAILSVSIGNDLQLAVIGSSGMTLPVDVGGDPLAYIQINFLVSYSSANDRISILGEITPSSFILTKDIRLGGGFAFYVWTGGPHAGDFVLTIGGYSPFYQKPALYPDVPRLSLKAKIDILTIEGEGYFALVPTALMAGIDIKATADLGPITAWFHASADFLIGWKPFTYQAHVGIVLGATFALDIGFVTIKMTIHVGVGLDVWGPDFGGRAVVDLSIISFAIDFGSSKQDAPTLNWQEFINFLPSKTESQAPTPVMRAAPIKAFAMMEPVAFYDAAPSATTSEKTLVSIDVSKGKLPRDQAAATASGVDFVVDANHFVIRAQCSAPSNAISYNDSPLSKDETYYLRPGNLRQQFKVNPKLVDHHPYIIDPAPATNDPSWFDVVIGSPPQKLDKLTSTLITTLKDEHGNYKEVMIRLIKSGVSPALWGSESNPVPDGSNTMTGTVVGVEFLPNLYFPSHTSYIQYYYLVFTTNNVFLEQDTAPVQDQTPFSNPTTILEDMANGSAFATTQATRSAAVDALNTLGFAQLNLENSAKLSTQNYVQPAELVHMTAA